jgi:ankyrin repeat protein
MLDLFVRTLGTSCLNQNQSPPLLHIAAKSKTSARTLEHLLQYQDIDVNIREADISALYWAVKCGNEDGTRMLLSHKDVDTQGIQKLGMLYDKAPLHIAAKSGHEAITEMLLGCPGIDLNVRDLSSRTPLSYAARFANSSLIKLLLAQEDTDTSISDGNGWAPFHEALKRGDEAIVMLFLERDDIKMRHQKDMEDIVLRTTASPGHTELLKSLLDQKIIRTEAVNSSSQTPLHHAARWGNMDAMCLLLNDKNIHPLNSADKRGETPLHIALRFGKGKVAQQLLSYNGIQLDTTNKKGQTLLHAAARGGHVEPAKLILQRKIIDLNHKDIEGDTALHVAIQWGHVEVAKLLLEDKSVALDVVTDSGMTLLHCAMDPFFPRSPQLDLLRMFLDRNVIDVNARMNSKHRDPTRHFVTALDLAKRLWWYRISDANREAIIQLLKAHGATESTSKDIPETSEITSNEVPDPETFQANINTAIEFPDSNLSVEAEDLDPDVEMGTDPFMGYGDSSCCDDSD